VVGRNNGELLRHLWCGRKNGAVCLPPLVYAMSEQLFTMAVTSDQIKPLKNICSEDFLIELVSCSFTYEDIQGVPRNMTLARRIESRLSTLKLLVTFSLQPSFTCMIPQTITTKFA
jgi:hypothetical protein